MPEGLWPLGLAQLANKAFLLIEQLIATGQLSRLPLATMLLCRSPCANDLPQQESKTDHCTCCLVKAPHLSNSYCCAEKGF